MTTKPKDVYKRQVFEEGVSLRLQPNNIGMKEDIILTEAPKSTAFSFELSVEGVVLELMEEDGVVLIKDQDCLLYTSRCV